MLEEIIKKIGPSRSSLVVEYLQEQGINADAARKRVSRLQPPLYRFPIDLLPKKESFVYHKTQRPSEKFWDNFLRDMRFTNSVYGATIDALIARGGAVNLSQFPCISSGTVTPKAGSLSSDAIFATLKEAQIIDDSDPGHPNTVYIRQASLCHSDIKGVIWRDKVEVILLDAIRQWARNLGMAAYNKITIRGDKEMKPVGPYHFDLVGPSYLMPLSRGKKQPGFLVADVIAEGTVDEFQIRSFIRKAQGLKAILVSGALPILIAPAFTGAALTAGHEAGVILATTANLFGKKIAEAIQALLNVLNNAAAHAATNADKLAELLDSLRSIEGTAGNLRGILFELIAAAIARRDAVSIDIGVSATNPKTGQKADIDVLKIMAQSAECACIECKGKEPGGRVSLAEVEDWIRRLPIFEAHIRNHYSLREAEITFEFWTTGTFDAAAITALIEEKNKRVKTTINWLAGKDVLKLSKKYKMKSITEALNNHYLKHPLNTQPIDIF